MSINDITSNIINQVGGGSGVDTNSLVDQLVELERAPDEQRLDQRQEKLEAQISGMGQLRNAVAEFDGTLSALANPDTFDTKEASISDTGLMDVKELSPDAVPGDYRMVIEQVARSQSLSSGSYESLDSEVGEGELTLRFGDWANDLSSFTADPDAEGATIELDESNNTLGGLRDAINDADIGVQASIVGEEGNYQLLVTGPTGASNEIELTATEGATPGLANFNFNETEQNFTEQQKGQDALVRVNGLQVSRESNTIDDVIGGMEFDIYNSDPNEEISIGISEDRSQAEQAIRDFVDGYNNFYEEMQFLLDREEGEDGQGSLRNDPLAGNMLRSVRGMLGGAVPGIEEGFNSLANMGIRTKLDGTLEIIEDEGPTDFRTAMDENFDQVRDMFVPNLSSDSSRIQADAYGSRTQPGSYDVNVTQEASKGFYEGAAPTAGFPLDTTGKDYSFTIAVDGNESDPITLPDGTVYDTEEELAEELQSLINLDSNIKDGNAEVNVTYENGAFRIESDRYGEDSEVAITSVGADTAELGISEGEGTVGQNAEGTIGGEEAFGYGNVLRGATGSDTEGLSLSLSPGATNATVGFSRGFGASMTQILNNYVNDSGLIADREERLEGDLDEVAEDRVELERRSQAFRERQEAQFRAMEEIVRGLNSTGSLLDDIGERLPFTSSG